MKFKQHPRTRSYPKTVTERSLSHVLFVFDFLFILQPLSFFPRREITLCLVVCATLELDDKFTIFRIASTHFSSQTT